jgi:nucleoside-diphosphate-sugar epimerase
MAVFITGGHGHIGSWAAKYLVEDGEEVLLYDLNPYVPHCLRNLQGKITFIPGDVMDFPRLSEVFRHYRGAITGILHTVGVMGELVLENVHHHVSLNIGGTHNMLEIARQFEIPKVVYTSSGAVYGAVPGIVAEDQYPMNPSDLYSATKAASEMLGRQYAQAYGFEFRTSRVYFCYGPGNGLRALSGFTGWPSGP